MALIRALNILLCKFVEALILTDTNVINLMVVMIIKNKVIQPKTYIQMFREMVIPQNELNESLLFDVDILLLF